MKKLCFLAVVSVIIVVFSSTAQAIHTVSINAFQGKATDGRDTNADGITGNDVMGNTSQLMTRNASSTDAKKSWLQFDLASLYAIDSGIRGNVTDSKLTFYCGKTDSGSKSYAVHGVNDAAGLESWVASALTWNTGPANNITSGNALDTTKTTSLYTATFPVTVVDAISETPVENRPALTSFLNTDTDGKITFAFTAGGTCYLWNVGQPLQPVLTMTYVLGYALDKAHYPIPADEAIVETTQSSLSWTLPDPNGVGGILTCDVYLGYLLPGQTEPNRPQMDKKTLTAGVSTVAINTTNFPTFGTLVNNKTYYWIVDIHDTSDPGVVNTGQAWSFTANNNQAPVADAGDDQAVWLGKSAIPGQEVVSLSGSATDDGLPTPPSLSYTWSQVPNDAPTVTPSPANAANTSVTITARGTYEFLLTVSDGNRQGTDTIQVFVGTTPCDASHMSTGDPYTGDQNMDCIVDLTDLASLILANWLHCTDTVTDCAR